MNKRKRTLFRRVYSAYTLNKFDGSFFFPLSLLCTHLSSFKINDDDDDDDDDEANFNCLQKNLANATEIKSHWMTFFEFILLYVCTHNNHQMSESQKYSLLSLFYFPVNLNCKFFSHNKIFFLTREREAYRIS